MNFIKMKNLYSSKDTDKRVSRQAPVWEKISANDTSD